MLKLSVFLLTILLPEYSCCDPRERDCTTPWYCPPGYTFHDSPGATSQLYCYKRVAINVDQETALTICRLEAGDLVSIHNKDENDFIHDNLVPIGKFDWIGYQTFGDKDTPDDKIPKNWTDGSVVDYIEPSNKGGSIKSRSGSAPDDKSCWSFSKESEKKNQWTSVLPCSEKERVNGFICRLPAIVPHPIDCGGFTTEEPPIPSTTPEQRKPKKIECPEKWIAYTDKNVGYVTKCFYAANDHDPSGQFPSSWSGAKESCQKIEKTATLATIANADEFSVIMSLINSASLYPRNASYWIGLFRPKSSTNVKESWKWDDGTPVSYYAKWFAQELDKDDKFCVRIRVEDDAWYHVAWWAEKCTEKMWGICQISGYKF